MSRLLPWDVVAAISSGGSAPSAKPRLQGAQERDQGRRAIVQMCRIRLQRQLL